MSLIFDYISSKYNIIFLDFTYYNHIQKCCFIYDNKKEG